MGYTELEVENLWEGGHCHCQNGKS
uniref:Uncharacterized protein n=1 Tax=Oryza barthii TaxID=65489 RepID=A0A0D3FWK9_9ORYZ